MRASAPLLRLAVVAFAAASSPAAAVDTPEPQVLIEARITEVSQKTVDELGFNWRQGSDGKPNLLLTTPAAVGGKPVDSIGLLLGRSFARALDPLLLPPGWELRTDGPKAILDGPAISDLPVLAFAFDCRAPTELKVQPEITLSSRGQPVLRMALELEKLNPAQRITDLAAVVRLPQRMAPGDLVRFVPLDPRFTPAGGDWTIGGVVARWNGDRAHPVYELTVPERFGEGTGEDWSVRVTYTDPWGTKLVDGRTTDCHLTRPSPPAEEPSVAACSPAVLDDAPFCVCGEFPEGSAAELTLNDRPIGKYLVASSPTILHFDLPSDFAPGALDLDAAQSSGFDIADGVRSVLVRLRAAIDRSKLRRGESTDVELALEGTDRPVDLRLTNLSPGIVTLAGGNDQTVTTSGGTPNRATRAVHAVSLGDFTLEYELEVGACPCAEVSGDDGPRAPEADEATIYDDFGPSEAVDHQEMEDEAVITADTVAVWREKRHDWWERAQKIDCRDEEAEKLIAEMVRATAELEEFLAAIWPKISQLQLEIEVLPAGEAAAQRAIAAAYSELGSILERLSALWLDLALLPRCEDVTHGDEVPADVGGGPAGDRVTDGDRTQQPPLAGGTTERRDDRLSPGRCGPDLTAAFDALLERTARRIAALPESDRGPVGGEGFLDRNAPPGWRGDDDPAPPPADGPSFLTDAAPAPFHGWNDGHERQERLIWWPAEPIVIGGPCALLDSTCQDTAWLWGVCLPVEEIADVYSGFVEGLLGTASDVEDEGSIPLRSAYGFGKLAGFFVKLGSGIGTRLEPPDPDGEPSPDSAGLGEWLRRWLSGLSVLPLCIGCAECPGFESTLTLDWTQRDWFLSGGRMQRPDGTIYEQSVL